MATETEEKDTQETPTTAPKAEDVETEEEEELEAEEAEETEEDEEEEKEEEDEEDDEEDEDPEVGVVDLLSILLADEVTLYTKLRKYHWNVRGANFFGLHAAFEEQYNAVAVIIDDIAEMIRQYGEFAIGTLGEFQELTRISEDPGEYPDAPTMVRNLVEAYDIIIGCLREDIEIADDHDDEVLEGYLTGLLQTHQKQAWMLRSVLE